MKKISIIVPCYNEEDVLSLFNEEIHKTVIDNIKENYTYELLFVNDGSSDNTLKVLKELKNTDDHIRIISFSRNFGKEAAMYAGLENCTGDLIVIMDADLQHSPEKILKMLDGISEGFDVVTTVRKNRKGESKIRSFLSRLFYKCMHGSSKVEVKQGAQDYRMMTRQVVNAILELKEYNRFSKGIFSWVGFNVKYIETDNRERAAGKSKWNFFGLFQYAKEGLISFSTMPLKISIILGLIISFVAIVLGIIIFAQTLFLGKDVPGYASTIVSVLFIGGIQLVSIGILSEYIAKMYMEIKNRPKYIIKDKID